VSGSELNAVDRMFRSLDSQGLRSSFCRINLFVGGFNGALVPQVRGFSRSGTQYGNATDTNSNFVSGDYSLPTGLTSLVTTKCLTTGLTMSAAGLLQDSVHVSTWVLTAGTTADRSYAGWDDGSGTPRPVFRLRNRLAGVGARWTYGLTSTNLQDGVDGRTGWFCGSNQSTRCDLFWNGASVASVGSPMSTSTQSAMPPGAGVFCDTLGSITDGRLGMYSFGLQLSAAQAAAAYSIFSAFLTAIGRS